MLGAVQIIRTFNPAYSVPGSQEPAVGSTVTIMHVRLWGVPLPLSIQWSKSSFFGSVMVKPNILIEVQWQH